MTVDLDQRRRAVHDPRLRSSSTKGDGTITITLNEGRGPQEIACIAIAEQHVTEFEIPDVAAGHVDDHATRAAVAPPVEVTVG